MTELVLAGIALGILGAAATYAAVVMAGWPADLYDTTRRGRSRERPTPRRRPSARGPAIAPDPLPAASSPPAPAHPGTSRPQ